MKGDRMLKTEFKIKDCQFTIVERTDEWDLVLCQKKQDGYFISLGRIKFKPTATKNAVYRVFNQETN